MQTLKRQDETRVSITFYLSSLSTANSPAVTKSISLSVPSFVESILLWYCCHLTQMTKTRMVRGIVMAGKSHHCDPTIIDSLPFSLVLVSKNTMLKMACNCECLSAYFPLIWRLDRRTETKVPGRKIIVRAATLEITLFSKCEEGGKKKNQLTHVIMEELSCWVETAILDESRAISRFIRLSAWVARLKKRLIRIPVRFV